ncbi:hypothetical protein I6T53_004552 [Salmonella enterica subsp. enterica serovar Corvallis]|nr:hypothetical protein [Salmonella enterica subsp. enterica serovar Corvallis]EMC8607775.1 hypothetical protein [Escherichia coli]HBN2022918.1 hypothetical protein [Escherichia coli]
MRDALKLADEATITARMNAIPHSNYRAVVFTKEQYARIPLRDDTVDEHAQDMLYDFVAAGRVASAMDSDSHRKEAARRRVLSEYSDTGTEKAEKYPYFEDMGFDSVIADEGHNYRNSYKNGREASQLAYLPTSAVAQSARDMAIKNAYLMKKNGGRGPVLLTATPVVNTPIDAYNMLSHVLPKEYWQKMGIYGPDDFVKFFGKTRLETVQKISGEVEEKMALVGFENFDALRGIFHRWTTLKTAEDVKDTVEIPELDEHQQDAPLTEEQLAAYEELRQQAEAVAKANNGVTTSVDEDGVIEHEKARPIFSIIRDMDRVCTDMDLYYRRITYRFLPEYADAVQQLADSLPKQATSEDDDSDDSITQQSQYSLIDKGEFIQLQVPEAFEQEVNKRLARFGIDEQTVTHPVTPKYAKLINHANEFLVIGDRSWRVGQYYDCAGDIVRIKSLDFDSQRADVEIIFTFKGTKSGNWDVKTLDKQVDVTPDEDAVMQKISGGVSIAGINDIISCDDFYRFQQRGMIKITDSYGVQTTESGYSIDFVGTYTDPLKHAVYPDRRDGALKSSIAKWVLGMMSEGNNRQVRLAEVFLTELFGSNYGEVIASYGDTLSPEAIQETIADAIARMPEKTSQGATRNGDSELEVTNAIFGTHEFRASDYEITTAQFGTIGIYSNKDEIKQAMDAASARIAAERKANLNHAVAALTQSWVTAIREAATTGKITPAIADVVNDGSKFMDAYQMDAVQLPSAYGQLSYRMTYNLVSMFSDLAILGLVDLNEVTPELLSMRKNHVEILQRINTVLAGRTDEEKQADADRINLALGNITEEEIAARNEKQEELSSIQGDATSIAQSLGLNYRVSTADLKMMYAPKFAAGEVFGLQEASGMKGVLFRAKDAIKEKFGARWLPAKAKNSDFPGNWWIIETKHNVADVLAVIQQYA